MLKSTAVKRFAELGFDMKRFIGCLEEVCPELPTESIPGIRHKLTEAFLERPQLVSRLKFANAVKSRPIKAKAISRPKIMAKMIEKPKMKTMFLPLDLEAEKKKDTTKPSRARGKIRPRPKGHKM